MRTKLLFILVFFAGIVFSQTWTQLPDFPGLACDDGVAVTVNGKGFFGTGFRSDAVNSDAFYSYDPSSNSWSAIASIPVGRQYACVWPGQNCFYVFGGSNTGGVLNDLYKYDLAANTWSLVGHKPGDGLYGASTLVYGDKVIIIGGKPQLTAEPVSEVWEYTMSSDNWQQRTNFPYGGRFRASSAVCLSTGYLLFGADDHDHFRKSMYAYNVVSDTWVMVTDFPQPAARVYASLNEISGRLYLFGGIDSTLACYNDLWNYEPSASNWSQSAPFTSFARKGGMSTVIGNTLYYSCGIDQSNTRLRETWKMDLPLTGISSYGTAGLSVFPNPVNDRLFITHDNGAVLTVAVITDLLGKELLHAAGNISSIDVSGLPPGIYLLRLQNSRGNVVVRKIVKE